jgi:HEPN domain-containing protein
MKHALLSFRGDPARTIIAGGREGHPRTKELTHAFRRLHRHVEELTEVVQDLRERVEELSDER